MTPIRIFISSDQQEFARERKRLRDFLRGDPLMRRFFDVFLFEEAPASDRRPDRAYLVEVDRCDIYVGLFRHDYGCEDAEGVSPTEREFERAMESEKHRLMFVKGAEGNDRHRKMESLIARAQPGLVWRRFATGAELIGGVYASLVQYLEARELLRFGPFDTAPCSGATLDDLDVEDMYRFIRIARRARQFPLPPEAPVEYEIPKEVVTWETRRYYPASECRNRSATPVALGLDRNEFSQHFCCQQHRWQQS